MPFTVKDSFNTVDLRTTRGSSLFADRVPSTDATAVARLRAADGILLGKTNLPEMSYWTETDNPVAGDKMLLVSSNEMGKDHAARAARVGHLAFTSATSVQENQFAVEYRETKRRLSNPA